MKNPRVPLVVCSGVVYPVIPLHMEVQDMTLPVFKQSQITRDMQRSTSTSKLSRPPAEGLMRVFMPASQASSALRDDGKRRSQVITVNQSALPGR